MNNKPQCCNKTTVEIQSGRVVSIEERTRYQVYFCPECGKSYITGLLNNENFLIRFSIPKPLMFEALNNEYQRVRNGGENNAGNQRDSNQKSKTIVNQS